jgi:hypothetical protein
MAADTDPFFATLQGLEPDEALEACLVQRERWQVEIVAKTAERSNLPRCDKHGAQRLLVEINAATAKLKRLRPMIASIRADFERQDTHSLWVLAVRELFGPDAPRACFDYMKAERKRRRQALQELSDLGQEIEARVSTGGEKG